MDLSLRSVFVSSAAQEENFVFLRNSHRKEKSVSFRYFLHSVWFYKKQVHTDLLNKPEILYAIEGPVKLFNTWRKKLERLSAIKPFNTYNKVDSLKFQRRCPATEHLCPQVALSPSCPPKLHQTQLRFFLQIFALSNLGGFLPESGGSTIKCYSYVYYCTDLVSGGIYFSRIRTWKTMEKNITLCHRGFHVKANAICNCIF